MFSQLQFVRLRTAEKALRDGRLDEALRLATAADLKGHRRAVAVCKELARQYVERARGHYREDRFAEGLVELDKAEIAGATGEEVQELRRNVQIVAHEVRRQDTSRHRRIDAARKRIEHGSLVAGQRLLENAGACDPVVADLQRDIAQRNEDVDRLVEQAKRLLDDGQIAAAVSRLEAATSLDHHDERLATLRSALCGRAFARVRENIVVGRLARASDELIGLGTLGAESTERRELADVLVAAREASAALEAARYADARRQVMSLQRIIPQAKWTGRVMNQLKQIDGLLTDLTTGPLGERLASDAAAASARNARGRPSQPGRSGTMKPRSTVPDETVMLPAPTAGGLPSRLLLLVEGGGSYLLLREPQVSIGRAACARPADVPLLSDIGERHASIERVGDDYFVVSAKGVEIDGRVVHHGLLRDGDRLVLGRRAKLTFRLPSRRSTTAVLELSDTTKMPHDVRRVVLLSRHATLGEGRQAHMICRHAGPPLLLIEKDGVLWMRQRNDGHVDGEAKRLALGESVEIGGACVVLSEWTTGATGTV